MEKLEDEVKRLNSFKGKVGFMTGYACAMKDVTEVLTKAKDNDETFAAFSTSRADEAEAIILGLKLKLKSEAN